MLTSTVGIIGHMVNIVCIVSESYWIDYRVLFDFVLHHKFFLVV